MTADYVSHWTMADALREAIANAYDASGRDITLKYDALLGEAVICDQGPGLKREHLLLGLSQKADPGQAIGQFGEGLKLALKCAATLNRPCEVETVGFSITPSFQVREAYGSVPVFVLTLSPNHRQCGTTVTIACDREEWEQAQNLFWDLRALDAIAPHLAWAPDGEPGALFINGLRAATFASPFWYAVSDKSLSNRDRTVIDGPRLDAALMQFWIDAPTAAWRELVIHALLDAATIESRLPWPEGFPTRTLKRALPWVKPVLVQGDDWNRAAAAALAGYDLLQVTPSVAQLFRMAGVKELHQLPRKVFEIAPATDADTWVFPITPHFGEDLSEADAAAELVANALDAGQAAITFDEPTNVLTIEDQGAGIQLDHLLLGEHQALHSGTIGQFGRGLKEAWVALTAQRDEPIVIETVGRTFTAAFEPYPAFQQPLWTVRWTPNPRTIGTRISLPHSRDIYRKLQHRFLALAAPDQLADGIYAASGQVYQRGLGLKHTLQLQFGYDVTDASIGISPSHQVIWGLEQAIGERWGRVTDPELAQRYFTTALEHPDADDFKNPPHVSGDTSRKRFWRAAARARWGEKCAVPDVYRPEATTQAEYYGATLVPASLPRGLLFFLHACGIKFASEVKAPKPTAAEKAAAHTARNDLLVTAWGEAFRESGWFDDDVRFVVWDPEEDRETQGLYDPATDTIFIRPDLLEDIPALLGVVLHELAHRATGASDLTQAFQAALTRLCGVFADQTMGYLFRTALDRALAQAHQPALTYRHASRPQYPFGLGGPALTDPEDRPQD